MTIYFAPIALGIALTFVGASSVAFAQDERPSASATHSFMRMADGKHWTTRNLDVKIDQSYRYDDSEENCRQFGRLYTWDSARRACRSLGAGWRVPTDDEWRQMAKHYGGIADDSEDNGRAAYAAHLDGGASRFNAVLGGNRSADGKYARRQAHGFYWTASETDRGSAPFYNFGKGSQALFRQSGGDKAMAISPSVASGIDSLLTPASGARA